DPTGRSQPRIGIAGVHRGRLYALLFGALSTPHAGEMPFSATLCRIDPERPSPVRKLGALPRGSPGTGYFDGDYYYFTGSEHQEDWWDWSQKGLVGRNVRMLYRCR